MASLVYAFIRAASYGWSDRLTLAAFAAAAALLGLFLVIETRARQPITPLHLFAHRSRAGSFLNRLLLVAGMFGMFFFLTQFVQNILGFTPLRAGVAFIPMTGVLFGVSRLTPRLLVRFGPNWLLVAGLLPVIGAMIWLSRLTPGAGYADGVLGPMLLLGGMGLAFVPLTMAALTEVRPADSGGAASLVNVTQQVGGSLGLAILVSVFSTASRNAAGHQASGLSAVAAAHHAVVHSMATAFALGAVFDVCAALIVLAVICPSYRPRPAAAAAGR